MRNRKAVNPSEKRHEEERGGAEGWEIAIRIYYMKKEKLFLLKEKYKI